MEKLSQTARGVAWNWVALAFGFAITFFLSPFVIHHLGPVAYGAWVLVASITAYMQLLDVGLRGAVIRFVSRDHASGNHLGVRRTVSAALWLRQWIGLIVIALSLLLSLCINRIFPVPAEMRLAAKWAVFLCGSSLAVSLVFGIFSGVLAALHRFDLLSGVSIGQTTLRAAGVIYLLRSGRGILAMAAWELVVVIFSSLILTALCFRVYRELRLSLRVPEIQILRDFLGYSSYLFLLHIFGLIIFYTDNVVVGRFVSVSAVTFYAIGGSISEYLRQIIAALTSTFLPLASRFEASGENDKLQRLLIQGTRVALFIAMPIELALFFLGQTFVELWVGSQYAAVSGRVLQILLLGQIFGIANSTSINIVLGLGKHRRCALWIGGEAIANLVLSILLVRRYGLYGVAVGTLIPDLIVQMILWPRYVCEVVQSSLRHYLWQSWIRPAVAAVPFGVACYFVHRNWIAHNLLVLFLQIVAMLPIYVASVVLFFGKEILGRFRSKRQEFAVVRAGPSQLLLSIEHPRSLPDKSLGDQAEAHPNG
jgi:O-antigen/teichoic acid export membrane protein